MIKTSSETKRSSNPIRVQQLWDCIRLSSTSDLLNFKDLTRRMKTLSHSSRIHQNEINEQLELAVKDKLIVAQVVKVEGRGDLNVYKFPEPATLQRGDSDWYCFICHLGGPVVKCQDCPRVCHWNCIDPKRKSWLQAFRCPPCHLMSSKPSDAKVRVTQEMLNQLITYACNRLKTWVAAPLNKADGNTWAAAALLPKKEAWRYDALVFFPMDLATMANKAASKNYVSLEEFQVDCETLVHSVAVYFGDRYHDKWQYTAYYKEALHEIKEIHICHQCYHRSHERFPSYWFSLPCSPPHDVVWAKEDGQGYPYWPAKVITMDENTVDVRYFGGNYERGVLNKINVKPITTPLAQLDIVKTKSWNFAYQELLKFQALAVDQKMIVSATQLDMTAATANNPHNSSAEIVNIIV